MLLVVVVALFAGLTYRVVELQAISPDRYAEVSTGQTVRTSTIAAPRGSILDRNGNELALSVPLRSIYADPQFVEDPAATAALLAPIVGAEPDQLEHDLTPRSESGATVDVTELDAAGIDATAQTVVNRFVWLERQVPGGLADEVEGLELAGIYLVDEAHRFTPSGDVGRALIGPTDIDNAGLGGLELQYEDLLSGTPGELTIERDPAGRTIAVGEQRLTPPVPGEGIVLTLDRSLQYEAERALLRHVEAHKAEAGTVVMMDPRSGEILAMASVAVDPEAGTPQVSTNNLALTTVYEPGSVMKVVGMSGAVEDGVLGPADFVSVPDSLTVADAEFTEYEPHGGGSWPLEDVLVHSSNTGSINVARQLGEQRLHHYFEQFGLGGTTGLDFPNELSGVVRPVDEWWGSSIGSMPIGQGISTTPLQMLLVYNAIANDGVFVAPSLVGATVDAEGVEHAVEGPEERRVVSSATASIVRDMLVEVVSRGTARQAQIEGYLGAGKTGTAQIPAPSGGYEWYDGNHYMATFAGFVPAHDPQLSMIVVTQHPTAGTYTGGRVSGPLFAELGDFALKHLGIAPTGVELEPADVMSPDDAEGPTEALPVSGPLGEPPEGRVRAEPAPAPQPVDDGSAPTGGTGFDGGTGLAEPLSTSAG